MQEILDAILNDVSGPELAELPLPETFRAATVHKDDVELFAGLLSEEKDPKKSIHIDQVPIPELAPDEAVVAVMASAINFNTVWTSIFEPLPTFLFLDRLGRESVWGKRHDLPYHIIGSDASGVILRTGSAVRNWKPGDRVTIHCNYVDDQDPTAHDDSMMAANQRIWGFESNFGGLADLTVVKANQLMPKPAHLTWEEAASPSLVNCTAYRQLVSKNGGGTPVAVVSSPEKVELMHELGVEHVIDRKAEGYRFWKDERTQDPAEWRRFGKRIRQLAGGDPDIVFEHPGRHTMGASVFVTRRGGTIITCAATSGYMIEYDNRYLWMSLKTIKGCHFANYREAWEANRLICQGKVQPILSAVYPLEETGEAALQIHHNLHEGKIGVLCLAPQEGLGITDPELRAQIGENKINVFRRHA